MGRVPKAGMYKLLRDACHRCGVDYSHLTMTHRNIPLSGLTPQRIEFALRNCKTIGDVASSLEITRNARSFEALEKYAEDKGIPVPPRRPTGTFDDEQAVREAVNSAVSAKHALDLLGAAASAKSYAAFNRAMEKFSIPSTVFEDNRKRGVVRDLETIRRVKNSRPLAWTCEVPADYVVELYHVHGSAVKVARELMNDFDLGDVSLHTVSQWARRSLRASGVRLKGTREGVNLSPLRKGVRYSRDRVLKALEDGGKFDVGTCSRCGIGREWEGEPLTLHVDHKDGDTYNNQEDNLRMLCPNCHSQTSTYCRRKK